MDDLNETIIHVIYLVGLQSPPFLSFLVFFLLFLIYCVTLCGNLLIITAVSYSKALHTPMYLFLSQLSLSDILLATDILPNLLCTMLVKEAKISFSACITQFFFFAVSGGSEFFLLTVMSYDRYLAICRLLHYNLIMNQKFCCMMVIAAWTMCIPVVSVQSSIISNFKYCGQNIIDHFFCDLLSIVQISCSDTANFQLAIKLLSAIFVVFPFALVILSYAYITVTIFKIPSVTGRQKVFSTCSSHLTVVSLYFGTITCVYVVPNRGQSRDISKFLGLLYTVITPLLNPIVYSLRNKDLKSAAWKLITKLFNLHVRK